MRYTTIQYKYMIVVHDTVCILLGTCIRIYKYSSELGARSAGCLLRTVVHLKMLAFAPYICIVFSVLFRG